MPASGFDLYNMQDARNNFDAMRPTPTCTDAVANQFMGQCQNIHISTNCYYGYHEPKRPQNIEMATDCEMVEATRDNAQPPLQNHGRKRSADDGDHLQIKRPRPVLSSEQKPIECKPYKFLPKHVPKTRGYGAINFQLQPMFTASNPQQPRYISLSHGPYDLISTNSTKLLTSQKTVSNSEILILSAEKQREKSIEPETNENMKLDRSKEELLETLYWNIHGGNFIDLLQCL